jgi:hypothetical protein
MNCVAPDERGARGDAAGLGQAASALLRSLLIACRSI